MISEFSLLEIVELTDLIYKETDDYFLELECEALASKLVYYKGEITAEYLDGFFSLCSINSVWKLVVDAENEIIREKAKQKLDEILEIYDDLEEGRDKTKKKER